MADNGIDADCFGEIGKGIIKQQTSFIAEGWNVFHYKQRDATAVRSKILSNFKTQLRGEINSIESKIKKSIASYTLFTNIDLTPQEKKILEQAILYGYKGTTQPKVEIIGAGELAAFVNNLPHIRLAFFSPQNFSTWERYAERKKNAKFYGAWVDFIGRQDELAKLKELINNKEIKVILLYGPQGIGKTRLLLEATHDCRHNVVFVEDPRSLKPSDLAIIESPYPNVIVAIDDAELQSAKSFIEEATARSNIKLIVTLPTSENPSLPFYGLDNRTMSFPVKNLTDSESDALLKATNEHMDYNLASWIKYNANGNPSILLAAARASESLKKRTESFIDTVGRDLEARIKTTLGEDSLSALRLLSILTHVGISGNFEAEVVLICSVLGEGFNLNKIKNEIPKLEREGLISRGGAFVEVALPIFATYLAKQLLIGREHAILILFSQLSDNAKERFLKRLSRLPTKDIQDFWNIIFAPDGLFPDLASIQRHIRIMHCIAAAEPQRVLEILEKKIGALDREGRLQISGDFRRELMWTLEQLLFRKSTSLGAFRIIGLLGEAENETWGNNASGVFCECAHPRHSQMPLALSDRYSVLEEFAAPEKSQSLRLLAIKAIKNALSRMGTFTLRESDGLEPFEGRPPMTYGEIWDYINRLATLIIKLAEDADPEVSKEACMAAPNVIAESIIQGVPEQGLQNLKKIFDWVKSGDKIDIADFGGALNLVREIFRDRLKKIEQPKNQERIGALLKELDSMKQQLDQGNFAVRLKRWTGKWTREDDEETGAGGRIYRYEQEIKNLAKEAVQNPANLTQNLLDWLLGGEAQKCYTFFYLLGQFDVEKKWLPKLQELAKEEKGASAFASYCGGLKTHSDKEINTIVDGLFRERKIHPYAILFAISYFGGNSDNVVKIVTLIKENLLPPDLVERILVCGRWIENLTEKDFLLLLKAIAGDDFKYDAEAIDMMCMWIHLKLPIKDELAEFAWQCLETAKPISRKDKTWDYDRLASRLAVDNPERGFALVKKLLSYEEEKRWNPIDRFHERKFWDTLTAFDRRKALELLLDIASKSPLHKLNITWNLQEILDQVKDKDLIIELSLRDEKKAIILSKCISLSKPGFWPVALPIIDHYITNEEILSNIFQGIEGLGFVVTGEYHLHLEKSRKEIETVLQQGGVPIKVRRWLEKIEEKYREAIEDCKQKEQNEEITGYLRYREYFSSNDQNLKEWAISKALQGSQWQEAIKQLNKADILLVMSRYPISEERKREILEKLG